MRLILARHGNTFAPGDRVIWVGPTLDLPLVDKGLEQARVFGAALKRHGVRLAAAYCSPLQRTRSFAEIALATGGQDLALTVDPRLNEIDYGLWTGRTREEIVGDLGHGAALEQWETAGVWPAAAGWSGNEAQVRADAKGFVDDIAARHGARDSVLVVSSNGTLRFIAELAEPPTEGRAPARIRTGHAGVLLLENRQRRLLCWDVAPDGPDFRLAP